MQGINAIFLHATISNTHIIIGVEKVWLESTCHLVSINSGLIPSQVLQPQPLFQPEETRKKIRQEILEQKVEKVYKKLQAIDPVSSEKISETDSLRITVKGISGN